MTLNFTVQYSDRVNDADDTDGGDVAEVPGIGWLYMEPQFPAGTRLPAGDLEAGPTGYAIRTFRGYLDESGTLQYTKGGVGPMRVWGNDPAWGLDRLQYRVTAELTDGKGRHVPFQPFFVDAKKVDETMYLAREMPRPGQKYGRGRPGWGVGGMDINEFGQLVIQREDGAELGAVTVPELSETLDESTAIAAAFSMTFGR